MSLDSLSFDKLVPKNSRFLSKEDVGEDGLILTIKEFKTDIIKNADDGTEQEKVVMHFQEADVKPMVLNQINSQLLKQITRARTAGEAKGKQIVVYNDPSVSFGGKVMGGLRIKKLPGEPARPATRVAGAASAQAPQAESAMADDEIPF